MNDGLLEKEVQDLIAAPVSLSDAESLIQQIFHQLGGEPSPENHLGEPEIVFEGEIGNARYVLIRIGPQPDPLPATLSPREKEIVRLIAKGLPNKAISEILEISPWTVATHIRRIFTKLRVNSRAEMIACVMQTGLLPVTQR